jgi:hypothetical protein
LAVYPDENTSADSAPTKSASAFSKSTCNSVFPVTSREPVEPAPQVRNAATPPAITAGCCDRPR